jgi:bacteriochlorophyllide a dehydrogenase
MRAAHIAADDRTGRADGLVTRAVVLRAPRELELTDIALPAPGAEDIVVDVEASGVSAGTERLLWTGRMPPFPGLGYPLVPGYESVGTITHAGTDSGRRVGERVFVPGARCFGEIRGLFGGAASRLVVAGRRVTPVAPELGDRAVLLALAATAYHALDAGGAHAPDAIVGHGVLGRLLARVAMARGAAPPVVWETAAARTSGASGYRVVHPDQDERRDYASIYDVSGDATLLDRLIGRLRPGGEIVLAGFYHERLSFAFPAAFQREARLRVAAEWQPKDLSSVAELVASGRLSLDGLITHRAAATEAAAAYATAFDDPTCLKMILDWRSAP